MTVANTVSPTLREPTPHEQTARGKPELLESAGGTRPMNQRTPNKDETIEFMVSGKARFRAVLTPRLIQAQEARGS